MNGGGGKGERSWVNGEGAAEGKVRKVVGMVVGTWVDEK